MTLTVGSLFTGIGGIDLGLERAGMRVLWQVEIDDWCRRVLAKHWPDVERFADVRDVGAHNLAPVDVICGGFPCQPVSTAGKQRGRADERWLWPEFARIVRGLPPARLAEAFAGTLPRGTPGKPTLYRRDPLTELMAFLGAPRKNVSLTRAREFARKG